MSDIKLTSECATWFSIASQLFSTRMAKLLAPHGLTPAQFGILNHVVRLDGKNGARISDIARAVEVGQPAVTKAIVKFENMGLVELSVSSKDRRSKKVLAKPHASVLIRTIHEAIGPDLHHVFSALEEGRIETFTAELKKIASWLDKNRLEE